VADDFGTEWEKYRRGLVGERRRIPKGVVKALKKLDFLGYDTAGQALQDIRAEKTLGKDWKKVWPGPGAKDLDEVARKSLSNATEAVDDYITKTTPKPAASKLMSEQQGKYSRAMFKQQTAKSRKPALKGVKGGRKAKMTAVEKAFAKELSGLRLIRGLISMGGIGAMFYEDIYGPLLQPKPNPWDLGT